MSQASGHLVRDMYDQHLKGASTKFAANPTNTRQNVLQRMHRRNLTELAMNRFKWLGLPTSVNERYLELSLFNTALVVYFDDPAFGQLALRAAQVGPLNMYEEPTSFTMVGPGYTGADRGIGECVPIWANMLRIPDIDIIEIYSYTLAVLDRTIEINSMNARRGKIVVAGENVRLSAANFVRQLEEGLATINLSGALQEVVSTIDLGIDPSSIEVLSVLRTRLKNDAKEMLGIDSANQDKKERLVSSEVGANDDATETSRNVALNSRRKAAREINAMFNQNITVEFHTQSDTDSEGNGVDLDDVDDNDDDEKENEK